jgi:hypothetical protein
MFYMVFTELLPEAFEDIAKPSAVGVLAVMTVAMLVFQAFIG